MSLLKVSEYNEAESRGRIELPIRFIQAFQPITFGTIGFPTRIEYAEEICKYLDCMHDGRLKEYYSLYSPSKEEVSYIRRLVHEIYVFTKKKYGKGILIQSPFLSANYMCRYVCIAQKIWGGGKQRETNYI